MFDKLGTDLSGRRKVIDAGAETGDLCAVMNAIERYGVEFMSGLPVLRFTGMETCS